MFYFTVLVVLLAIYLVFKNVNDSYIEVSRHTQNLTNDMIFAVFKSFRQFEQIHQSNISFLLNNNIVSKQQVEAEADNIMFTFGEFPASQLEIDPRDFHRLVKIHDEYLQEANDLQIRFLIDTLY